MKHFQLILACVIAFISLVGCKSLDSTKQAAQRRDALDQQEKWRYDLPDPEIAPLRPTFPKAVTAKLKNGMTIYVVEDHRLPIAEVSLVMKGGSSLDPKTQAGLHHLTALMAKEGTKGMTALELAEGFSNLGTDARLAVTKDFSSITTSVMSTKVDDVIPLIAAMAKEPRFAQDDFDRVKLQHQSMLASQQGNLAYVAQTNFLALAYGDDHPYGRPSAGSVGSIGKITLADIKKAHQKHFGPNNAALIVIGDVSLKQIKALAKKNFAAWNKATPIPATIADRPPVKQMQTKLIGRSHTPQTMIVVGQPVATVKDADLPALEVLLSVVGGFPHSRLDANLREKKGWTYGVGSNVTPLRGKGPVLVSTSIQVPYGADALNEILLEYKRLQTENLTDDELASAKNGLLHSFAGRYSTVTKIHASILNQFVYSLPASFDESYYDKIAKVTKEEIMKVAKRALNKDQLVAITVGDLEAMEVPIAKMDVGKVTIERETPSAP